MTLLRGDLYGAMLVSSGAAETPDGYYTGYAREFKWHPHDRYTGLTWLRSEAYVSASANRPAGDLKRLSGWTSQKWWRGRLVTNESTYWSVKPSAVKVFPILRPKIGDGALAFGVRVPLKNVTVYEWYLYVAVGPVVTIQSMTGVKPITSAHVIAWLGRAINGRVVEELAPHGRGEWPVLTGTATPGLTLSATTGVWVGGIDLTYTYDWQRCDAQQVTCESVPGASGATYQVTSEDVGLRIRAMVTVSNRYGHEAMGTDASPTVA